MNRELEFILNVIQKLPIKSLKNLDWYWITGFLELNKISGYFYNRIKNSDIQIPQLAERKLSQIFNYQKEKNRIMSEYIKTINNALIKENINFALLKGSVLCNCNFETDKISKEAIDVYEIIGRNRQKHSFYEEGERVFNDIDILTDSKNITNISEILKSMGFIQGYYNFKEEDMVPLSRREVVSRRMNRGETAPFIIKLNNKTVPFIEVDINFSLDYLPNSDEVLLQHMLNGTSIYISDFLGTVKSLNVDDFFLQLILHQYKESVLYSMVKRNKDVQIYKFLDIYLFIKRNYISLKEIYKIAEKYNILIPLLSVIKDLEELFSNISCELNDSIKSNNVNIAKRIIDFDRGKNYIWTKNLYQRMNKFDKTKYLSEEDND